MVALSTELVKSEDYEALSTWLLSKPNLTSGSLVEKAETRLAELLGVESTVFTNSVNSANLLALTTLVCSGKLQKGGKIIVPATCNIQNISSISHLGFTPILVDVNQRNLGPDLSELTKAIEYHRPAAMFVVSVLGLSADMDEIVAMCKKNNVVLIEDNTSSIGSEFDGLMLGSFGYLSIFKIGEYGFIATNNSEHWQRMKNIRCDRYDTDDVWFPCFDFMPNELDGFLATAQIGRIKKTIKGRNDLFAFYSKNLSKNLWKPTSPEENFVSGESYPIMHNKADEIKGALLEAGIEYGTILSGSIANHSAYRRELNTLTLPFAHKVHKFGLSLPCHSEISSDELYTIYTTINKIVK